MSDLVERLLRYRDVLAWHDGNAAAAQAKLIGETIAEIEQLEASLNNDMFEKLADEIERLEAELRDAHYHGYMAGAGDSEDYDHDPIVMEKLAWQEHLEGGDD
jgi:hypothetical protein